MAGIPPPDSNTPPNGFNVGDWGLSGMSGIASLADRSEANVREALQAALSAGGAWKGLSDTLCGLVENTPFIQGMTSLTEGDTVLHRLFEGLQFIFDTLCSILTLGTYQPNTATPTSLLDGISNLIQGILDNPVVASLIEWSQDVGASVGDLVGDIFGGLMALFEGLCSIITTGELPNEYGNWSPMSISDLLEDIGGILGALLNNPLVNGFKDLVEGTGKLLHDVVAGIVEFLQSFVGILGINEANPGGILEFLQNLVDCLWGIVTGTAGAVGKTLTDLAAGFGTMVHNLLESFGAGTVIGDVINFIQSIFEAIGDVTHIDDIVEWIQDTVACLWEIVTGSVATGTKTLQQLFGAVAETIQNIMWSFGDGTIITDIISGIQNFVGIIGDLASNGVAGIIEFIQDSVDFLWNLFASGTGQIGKTIKDLVTGIVNTFGGLLGAFGNGTVFNDVISFIQSVVGMLGDVLHIDDIVEFLQDAIDFVWNTITSGAGQVGKTIQDLIEGIAETFGGFLGAFGDGTVVDDVIGFIQGLVGMFGDILHVDDITNFFQDAVDRLWNLFTSSVGGVGKTFENLVDGIEDAFSGFLGAFGDGTVFDDVITFIQNVFGVFGDWLHLDEIVEFFQGLVGMLGLDDITPGGIIAFLQQKIDKLFAVFNGVGSVGNTIHDVLESIVEWFQDLPFIRVIVGAFVPGATVLGDLKSWVDTLLSITSWLPAGNLRGQVPQGVLGIIPAAHVGESAANLLTAGGFTTEDTIAAGSGWSWDSTQNYSGTGGCVKVVCDNTTKRLHSNIVPVSEGHKMAVSVYAKWSSLSPTTGDHFGVQIEKYLGETFLGYDTILTKTDPGASSSWVQLIGNNYQVPLGVDRIRMVLWTDATSGTIWWDDAYFAKTGLGAIADPIVEIFHQGQDASPFTPGTLLDDLWSAIFGHQKTVTGTSASNLELLNRLSNVSGGAIAVDDFERVNTSNLGNTIWEQTYTNSGHGKLAIPNGHDAEWDGVLIGGTNFCMCRFLGTTNSAATSLTDYQRVSIVLGSAPRRGANGTASNDVVCRLNPSRNYFVRARWKADGEVIIHKYVNGVETQLTTLGGAPVSASAPTIPNAGSTLTLDAGDVRTGNKWIFTAYQDGQPILTAYDLAQTSKAESGYRGWGFAVESQSGWPLGQVLPGKLYYWTACDQGAGSSVAGSLVSSGISATNVTTGTLDVANRVAAGAVTNTKVGSDIDGSKITAGLVNGNRIQTNLTAGHIGSGTFTDSFIASGLSATKLTTGTLDTARISSGTIANGHLAASGLDIGKMTTGTLNMGRVANSSVTNTHLGTDLDGSKITAGLVNGSRVQTNLTTSHIASGTFGNSFIASGLDAGKLTTGTLDTGRIGTGAIGGVKLASDIDASKIFSGILNILRIPTNDLTKDNIADLGDVYTAHVDAVGSGATMVRTSSSNVTISNSNTGPVVLPASFFGVNLVSSADITVDLTNGAYSVSLDGWYRIDIAYKINAGVSAIWNICPVVFVNGSVAKYMNDGCSQSTGGVRLRTIHDSTELYLESGDIIRAGYDAENATGTISNVLTGESSGTQCYFSISLTNRSLA